MRMTSQSYRIMNTASSSFNNVYIISTLYLFEYECHSNSNMTLRNELVGVSYSITRVLCCKTTMKYILSLSRALFRAAYMISFIIPHSNMILQNDEVASIKQTHALKNLCCETTVSFLFTLTC